jgi:hypothetical protein
VVRWQDSLLALLLAALPALPLPKSLAELGAAAAILEPSATAPGGNTNAAASSPRRSPQRPAAAAAAATATAAAGGGADGEPNVREAGAGAHHGAEASPMVIEGSPLLPFLVDAADRKIVLEWLLDLLLYLPPLASAPHVSVVNRL